uniref:Uncharacterized protein n=1 Tax=Arundo donax TaxID=35708 RepID=A0A0A9ERK2_ARUDO
MITNPCNYGATNFSRRLAAIVY